MNAFNCNVYLPMSYKGLIRRNTFVVDFSPQRNLRPARLQ